MFRNRYPEVAELIDSDQDLAVSPENLRPMCQLNFADRYVDALYYDTESVDRITQLKIYHGPHSDLGLGIGRPATITEDLAKTPFVDQHHSASFGEEGERPNITAIIASYVSAHTLNGLIERYHGDNSLSVEEAPTELLGGRLQAGHIVEALAESKLLVANRKYLEAYHDLSTHDMHAESRLLASVRFNRGVREAAERIIEKHGIAAVHDVEYTLPNIPGVKVKAVDYRPKSVLQLAQLLDSVALDIKKMAETALEIEQGIGGYRMKKLVMLLGAIGLGKGYRCLLPEAIERTGFISPIEGAQIKYDNERSQLAHVLGMRATMIEVEGLDPEAEEQTSAKGRVDRLRATQKQLLVG